MGLNLETMKSFGQKRNALAKFLANVSTDNSGAVCWVIHATLNVWQEAVAAEDSEAINLEFLLAEHRGKFQPGHKKRIEKEGLTIRHLADPDFLIEGGAEVVKDDGRQVILRMTPDEQPKTFYRRMSAEELSAKVTAAKGRSKERKAKLATACQDRRGDAVRNRGKQAA